MRRRILSSVLSAALVAQLVPVVQAAPAPRVPQQGPTFNRDLSESVKAAVLAKAQEARKAVMTAAKAPQGLAVGATPVEIAVRQDLAKPPYAASDVVRVMVEVDSLSVAEVAIKSGKKLSQLSKAEMAEVRSAALSKAQAIAPAVAGLGGKVRQEFGLLVAAVSAEIEFGQIEELKKIPGVKNVTLVNSYLPENKVSAPLVGAAALHGAGTDGTGTVIAIVDTGINYSHEAFGAQSALDPNGKVIGGWNFADGDAEVQSAPGTSPHGTHVAGTAAGIGAFAGVAPGAKLLAQKVFSNNPEYGSAYGDDILAALEDSILDTTGDMSLPAQRRHPAADVINMSLGSPSGWVDPNDASIRGVDNAVAAGVVVTISAGNSGHNFSQVYTYPIYRNQDIAAVGSPSLTPGSISVAASHNNIVYVDGASFAPTVLDAGGNPVDLSAISTKLVYTEGSGPVPFSTLGNTSYDLVVANPGSNNKFEGCTAADIPDSVNGKVALIARGTCTFQVKVDNAAAKGAVAVLIYNNASDDNGTISMATDAATVPNAMIFNSVGTLLKDALAAGGSATAEFNGPAVSVELPGPLVDTMTTFSSWGTTPDLAPKPDVTAPGQNIKSPTWGPDTYENYQGTSMAAPHVAGASALLKQAHPDWGPAEIKLALMNTAKVLMQGAVPFSPRQQGAGRIQLVEAESTPVLARATTGLGVGTGHLALGQVAPGSVTSFSFELNNLSNEELTYTVPATVPVYRPRTIGGVFNALANEAWSGAAVTFSTTSYTIPAGGTVTVTGELNLAAALLHAQGAYGHFAETFVPVTAPSGHPNLSLPLVAYAGDWSAVPIIEGDPTDPWCFNCMTGLYQPVGDSLYQLGWNAEDDYSQSFIAFSPNGDGEQEEIYPVATFLRNAKNVTVDVKSAGRTLRRLGNQNLMRNQRAYNSAPYIFSPWDGTVYNNATGGFDPVAEGEYVVQVKAMPATGTTAQTYNFPVKVDVTSPESALTTPLFTDADEVTVDWVSTDENSGLWGHFLFLNGEMVSGAALAPSDTSEVVDLSGYTSGSYFELVLVTFDNAGNVAVDGGFWIGENESLLVSPDTYLTHPGGDLSFWVTSADVAYVNWSLETGDTGTGTITGTGIDTLLTVTMPETLVNGDHTLTLSAYDATDTLLRTYNVPVNSDNVAPSLTIFSPQQKEWYGSSDVVIDYETDEDATVYVNDTPVAAGDTITLADGEHHVTLQAVDAHGNEGAPRSVSIYVDTTAPVVTLTGIPDNGIVVTEGETYTVMGQVEDELLPYTLKVNGSVVYDEPNMADEAAPFAIEWDVDLVAGDNLVTVEAVDALGNTATQTFTVKRGTVALSNLTVDKTLFSPTVSGVKATVTMSVKAAVTLEVRDANGDLVKRLLSGTRNAGTFSASWNGRNARNQIVADGDYTIVASTTTGGYLTQTVTVDSTKPGVAFDTPTAGQLVETNTLTVTASSADAVSVKLSMSGAASLRPVAMTPVEGQPGQFEATLTFAKDGAYKLTAEAMDAAGNKQSVQTTFSVDLAPTITMTGAATITSRFKTVKLTGKSNERLSAITVGVEEYTEGVDYTIATYVTSSGWTASLTFVNDGEYVVTVSGTDKTGHESGPATKTILIDTEAPELIDWALDAEENALYLLLGDAGSGVKPGTVKVKIGMSIKTAVYVEDILGLPVYKVALPTNNGTYKVFVTMTDLAGNLRRYPGSTTPDFVLTLPDDLVDVDRTAPLGLN